MCILLLFPILTMKKSTVKHLAIAFTLLSTLCVSIICGQQRGVTASVEADGVSSSEQESRLLSYTVLNQPVNDLAYSSTQSLLYASVPSTGGMYGNYIIAINPMTRQITGGVFAGSEPNKLAMSSDEQFLYVGLDGGAAIRRVVLDSMTTDQMFSLGSGSNGAHYPEDIAVITGQPNVIAVSHRNLCCSPRHEGVAIYDNGVRRPSMTTVKSNNEIETGDDGSTLYTYNNETSDFTFRRMLVDANGVSTISSFQNSFGAYSLEIRHSTGRVYANNGRIIDATTGSPVGIFALGGSANGLVIDIANYRALFVIGNTLKGFNSDNFQPTGSVTLPDSVHTKARLIRWGRHGIAYRISNGNLAIAETALATRKLER